MDVKDTNVGLLKYEFDLGNAVDTIAKLVDVLEKLDSKVSEQLIACTSKPCTSVSFFC